MRARACGARTAGSIRTRPCGRCCSLYPPSQTPATHTPTRNTRIHAPRHCCHAHTRPHRLIDGSTVGLSLRTAWMRFGATPQFPRRPLAHARALAHCDTHTACAHAPPVGPARDSARMHHSLRCTREWPRSGCQRRRSCDGVRRLLQGKSCTLPAHTRSARIYARTLQARTQNARTRALTRTRVPDVQPWPWVQPARCAALISDRRHKERSG